MMPSADNLRYLLELSRSGRLVEAGRRLGVDHTTVSRRISALERETGERLFDRHIAGWQLTGAGQRMLPYAESVEAAMAAAYDTTNSATLTGAVRIVAPDGFGMYVLAPALSGLRAAHPGLVIEVVTATSQDPLTVREFDVAITLVKPQRRSSIITKLATYSLGLYAAEEYLDAIGPPVDLIELGRCTLIWYVDALLDVAPLQLLDHLGPGVAAQVQMNNIGGHHQAARSGLGIAPLPTYVGDPDPRLVRILPQQFSVIRQYWQVVPRDIARSTRVRAVADILADTVANHDHLTAEPVATQ